MDFYKYGQSCAIHFSCDKERKETKNRIEWSTQQIVGEYRPKAAAEAIFLDFGQNEDLTATRQLCDLTVHTIDMKPLRGTQFQQFRVADSYQ